MEKSVIAIIRTSTNRQEVESQKQELLQFIQRDGVNLDTVEVIGEAGASAIKLDEKYRRNMAKVYDLIATGNIKTIYAWALDRIGRDEEFMVKFKNCLIDRGINLKIVNPSLTLLNYDGTVNNGMEIAFSLYITMSKQEMEQKKARFQRAKKRNAEQGKFSGGILKYGYMKDSDNFLVPDPETSAVIRKVFDLFATGNYSVHTLCDEMADYGHSFRWNYMYSVLTDEAYCGGRSKIARFDRYYPAIVTRDLFDRVQAVLKSNRSSQSRRTVHYHFAATLLKCPQCCHSLVANGRIYMCRFPGCTNRENISIPILDGILLRTASDIRDRIARIDVTKTAAKMSKRIEDLEAKLMATERKRSAVQQRLDRAKRLYIDGILDEEGFKTETDRIRESTLNLDEMTEAWHIEIMQLIDSRERLLHEPHTESYEFPIEGDFEVSSSEGERLSKFVKESVSRVEFRTDKFAVDSTVERITRTIEVTAIDGIVSTVYLVPFKKIGPRVYRKTTTGNFIPYPTPFVKHND